MTDKFIKNDGLSGERWSDMCRRDILRLEGKIDILREMQERIAADYDGVSPDYIRYLLNILLREREALAADFLQAVNLSSKEEDQADELSTRELTVRENKKQKLKL